MARKEKGIALVSVLVAMVAVLLLSLATGYWAQTALSTGSALAQKARARQLAEAGVDHALAYLASTRPTASVTLTGDLGYTATLTPNRDGTYRVESRASTGSARHTAVAVIGIEDIPAQTLHPLFGNGWISGGRITVNGGVDLRNSRLHADKGYANLSGQIQVCNEDGSNCRNINQVSPPPITGGAGVSDTQCNASGNNRVVCQNDAPKYQVCPVYQSPSDPNMRCTDLVTGRVVSWRDAYKITAPDVNAMAQKALGVRASSPFQDAVTGGLCDVRFTSLDPGQSAELVNFLLSRGVTGGLPSDVNQLLALVLNRLNGSGLKVCVQNNVTLPGGTSLSGVTFYVGGTFQVNGSVTLSGVDVAAGSGLNLGNVQATNARFYTGGSLNLNSDANFKGNSVLASRQSITFNGSANLLDNRALAIVSEGDITFNGRADTHAFMWAGGQITFNGTGAFIGGAVSLGGTIRNGGGQFYIQNSNANNTDLPQTDTGSDQRPWVLYRR
ncbi:pilus assembly PilX family protein [Thermus filiformis]|uniref:Type 4 fimbrial biogenesis protein PilX N-terminal domain-containing protein n=1 Tax=Thermus filiformis TaxID=276 RepID=A0A0A2WQ65_THEFI|nr:hypothetical protein [Thermus filiformis]KGQ20907.1 hypothetical protein THFILI_06500 [Thermus filiformis]